MLLSLFNYSVTRTLALTAGALVFLPIANATPPALFSLDHALEKPILGLELEEESVRAPLLQKARAFLDWTHVIHPFESAKKKNSRCLAELNANPFCSYLDLLSERKPPTLTNPNPTPMPEPLLQRENWIRAKLEACSLKVLHAVEDKEILRALKNYPNSEPFQACVQGKIKAFTCSEANAMIALALHHEEYLPDPKALETVLQIYHHAHTCPKKNYIEKASYRGGMLSVLQGKWTAALRFLKPLADLHDKNDYGTRALYWAAEAATHLQQPQTAAKYRKTLVEEYPFQLHTLLLLRQKTIPISVSLVPVQALEKHEQQLHYRSKSNTSVNQLLRLTEALILAGDTALAQRLAWRSQRLLRHEPLLSLYIAYLLQRTKSFPSKLLLLSRIFKSDPTMLSRASLKLFYPVLTDPMILSQQSGIDPRLVFSLIRQESSFDEYAQSPAGAIGLMQILPVTALKFEPIPAADLFKPANNIRIGIQYLGELVKKFQGDLELVLASYNAGPEKVEKWVLRYPTSHRLLFMDLIPFKETRNYVASIARNYYWYSELYPAPATEPGKVPLPLASFQVFR